MTKYQKRKSEGLCVKCKQPHNTGKTKCFECTVKKAQADKKRYESRISQNVCQNCGQKAPLDRALCLACTAKGNNAHKKRYESRRLQNLCEKCGHPSPDRTKCGECNTKANKIHKKRYESRRSQNLCLYCGEQAQPDQILCLSCAIKDTARQAGQREGRLEASLCPRCASETSGNVYCDDCTSKQRAYSKERYHNDVNYRLAHLLRSRLYGALKNNYRAGSAVRDLGCSISFLKEYLEAQFQPGMTWDNHGEWHIDHIRPLNSFDLTDREQFLQACHFSNLQPLLAEENLQKGDKFTL